MAANHVPRPRGTLAGERLAGEPTRRAGRDVALLQRHPGGLSALEAVVYVNSVVGRGIDRGPAIAGPLPKRLKILALASPRDTKLREVDRVAGLIGQRAEASRRAESAAEAGSTSRSSCSGLRPARCERGWRRTSLIWSRATPACSRPRLTRENPSRIKHYGGADGTRTRNFWRDRPVL